MNPLPDFLAPDLPKTVVEAPLFSRLPQKALRQNVLTSLLKAIFKGQLREGAWLNAQKLAEQLGVSATPVREALVELATIGIVETKHNRGTMVRPFGPVQLADIYHLRRVLEAEATRCACGKIPIQTLNALKAEMLELKQNRHQPSWGERAMQADQQLHEVIINYSGSQRLAEEIGRYNTLIQCIREVVADESHAQQRALPEHIDIIEALLANNSELGAELMARHIQSTEAAVREALFPAAPLDKTPEAKV